MNLGYVELLEHYLRDQVRITKRGLVMRKIDYYINNIVNKMEVNKSLLSYEPKLDSFANEVFQCVGKGECLNANELDNVKNIIKYKFNHRQCLNSTRLLLSDDADIKWVFREHYDNDIWCNIPDESFLLELSSSVLKIDTREYFSIYCRKGVVENKTVIEVSINSFELQYNNLVRPKYYGSYFIYPYSNGRVYYQGDLSGSKRRVLLVDNPNTSYKDVEDSIPLICLFIIYFAISEYVKTMGSQRIKRVKQRQKVNPNNEVLVISKNDKKNKIVFIPLSKYLVKYVSTEYEYKGGHHASPHPHHVKGHWRRYKSGRLVWVDGYFKSCLNYETKGRHDKVIVVDK